MILFPISFIIILFFLDEAGFWLKQQWDLRSILLVAVVFWAGFLVAATEVLSIFHLLVLNGLFFSWGGLSLILLCFSIVSRLKRQGNYFPNWLRLNIRDLCNTPVMVGLCLIVIIQLLVLFLTASHYSPNNWDSMTYHLARTMHWEQNASVADFATNIDRQIQLQPFAEFVLTHAHILSGSDHFDNYLQWLAMFFSGISLSLIAKKLGGQMQTQFLAAVFCWTLPMGVIQATSTQTDYVAAFWLSTFIALGLTWLNHPKNIFFLFATGLALGLGLLTKATIYIFAMPFCLWFGFEIIKRTRFNSALLGSVIVILVLLPNFGYFERNMDIYGTPLGPEKFYNNTIFTPQALAANALRNIGLNLTIPYNGIKPYNDLVMRVVHKFYGLTGLDPDDQRITYTNTSPYKYRLLPDEDYVGNPIHLYFMAIAVLALCAKFSLGFITHLKKKKTLPVFSMVDTYVLMLMAGFFLFCLILKWQPWNTRLHLPLFAIFSPAVSILVINQKWKHSLWVGIVLVILSFYYICFNTTRPANPFTSIWHESATDQYFIRRPTLQFAYENIVTDIQISGCHNIGIEMNEDSWEYPYWVLFRQANYDVVIEHLQVKNETAQKQNSNFIPCAVIVEAPQLIPPLGYYKQYNSDLTVSFLTVPQ